MKTIKTLEQYIKEKQLRVEQFTDDPKKIEKLKAWYNLNYKETIEEPIPDPNCFLDRARYWVDKKGSYEFYGINSANQLLPWEIVRILECSHEQMRRIADWSSGGFHSSDYDTCFIYSCPNCGLTNKFQHFNEEEIYWNGLSMNFLYDLMSEYEHKKQSKQKIK